MAEFRDTARDAAADDDLRYRLAIIRGLARLTPAALAERAAIDVVKVLDVEAGTYDPRASECQRLADALGVTVDFLFGTV